MNQFSGLSEQIVTAIISELNAPMGTPSAYLTAYNSLWHIMEEARTKLNFELAARPVAAISTPETEPGI